MRINPAIFRAYDIRGKVGESLTSRVSEAVGKAFGTYIKSLGGKRVSVSRDNRESSQELATDFIRGVLSTGVDVLDFGLTTTPMFYFSIIKFNLDGGAIITGSHSTLDYNGIKLCKKDALHIFGDELKKIQRLVKDENFASGRGKLSKEDIFDEYEAEILDRIKLRRSLKVAVDCGDGVTGPFAPEIFAKLGCQVYRYACGAHGATPSVALAKEGKPLGNFPHGGSDPSVPKNLEDLSEIVTTRDCNLGIGLDADGDRLGVVDEKGNYVPIEKIAFLLVKNILKKRRFSLSDLRSFLDRTRYKFVCDVKSLSGFQKMVEGLGARVEMLPTGRSFFRQKLYNDPQVLLGVEASGHIHINDNYFGFDDGIFAAVRLLEVLSKSRKSLSELVSEFPQSFFTPEIRLPCPDEKKFVLVEKVRRNFAAKYDTIEIDGVRVKFDQNSWFLVRAKNTGPYLSLRFEADTKEKILEMAGIVASELGKHSEISPSWRDEIEIMNGNN